MNDYFDRIERQLVAEVQTGRPRRSRRGVRPDQLAVVASLLVVVAVSAVFLGIRGPGATGSPANPRAVKVILSASPLTPQTPLSPAVGRSVEILRERLDTVFRGAHVSRVAAGVMIVVPRARGVSRARILALAVPGRLAFYDWEANALTPNGETVASQLRALDRPALTISQGGAATAPGEPGAGSLALYGAVKLASRQPPINRLPRGVSGARYFLFGAPGSAACRTAAQDQGTLAVAGVHCLLAGPTPGARGLAAHLPAGVTASQGRRLEVPPGIVVLQAQDAAAAHPTPFSSPAAQFYVLRDNPVLSGRDITEPQASTDASGAPDLAFSFRPAGATKFQQVTATIARRGNVVSPSGAPLLQHFAVALDDKLITVASIDFRVYPDGISGGGGADIAGAFTVQSAQTLATLLRFGPLPVALTTR